jgi:host factor-I protein
VIKLLSDIDVRPLSVGTMRKSRIIFDRSERELASMQKTQNIQDTLLNQIRREKQTVTFFLMNGFQLKGVVRSFDSFVVILETDGRQQMIYKHAISTIVPASTVDLREPRYVDDKEHS